MSGMGRHVSFDQAVAWKVLGEDSNVHCLAFCFVNWCPSCGLFPGTPSSSISFLYEQSHRLLQDFFCT
jgi:hypothetical protein